MKNYKRVQRLFSFVLAIALLVTTMPVGTLTVNAASSEFAGGSGTEVDPYLISTKEHLDNLRNHLSSFSSPYFKLTNDIIFNDSDFVEGGEYYNDGNLWLPIGHNTLFCFSGTLDGNGFSIINLQINGEAVEWGKIGLFSSCAGTIKNLSLTNAHINVSGKEGPVFVGGFAGDLSYYSGATPKYGKINNCNFSGEITVTSDDFWNCVGGVVGMTSNYNEVIACHNYGKITSQLDAGGIVGDNGGLVSDCCNNGEIIISNSDSTFTTHGGGICSENLGTVENCYNTGSVTSNANFGYDGGIAGGNGNLITDCYNTGTISGGSVGGIIGSSQGTTQRCYNVGIVEGIYHTGGIVSYIFSGSINDCYYIEGNDSKGIKVSSEELKNVTALNAFDFENTWELAEGNLYVYPTIKSNSHYLLSEGDFQCGLGTENDPYLIASPQQLNNVKLHLDANFKMVRDVVFKRSDFKGGGHFYNAGTGWEPIDEFIGHFDGCGFAIKGIISKNGGIFNHINGAVVENLNIHSAEYGLETESSNTVYIGSIANVMNNSTIKNCHNESNIELKSTGRLSVGGIVGTTGNNENNIINCTNKGNLSGKSVGGIVGIGNNVTIRNCYNSGEINAYANLDSCANAGGIAGISRGSIEGCHNIGAISLVFEDSLENHAYSHYCGGIVGDGYKTTVSNCYNTADISCKVEDSSVYLGGIVGMTHSGTVSKSYNTGCLKAQGTSKAHGVVDHIKVGGVVGASHGASIVSSCYNVGKVESVSISTNAVTVAFAGGVAGNVDGRNTKVYDCYNIGDVNAEHTVAEEKDGSALAGGAFGAVMNSGSVNRCYNMGKVMASSNWESAKYGGISGQGKTGTIDACYYLDIVDVGVVDSNGITTSGTIENFSTSTFFEELDFGNTWTMNGPEGYPFPSLVECPMKTCETSGSHVYITDKAIEPTCGKTGLTEGKHCYVCGKMLIKQIIIEATGLHNWNDGTTDANGNMHYSCDSCDSTYSKNLVSIKITTQPNKLVYLEDDPFDKTGMVITAYYDNDTNAVITDYNISGYSSTPGSKTITVTHGGKTTTFTVTVNSRVPSSITSSAYTISGGNISKITAGATVSSLLSGLNEGSYCKVFKGNSEVNGSTFVGTGMVVKIMDGSTVKASYTIIVTGDTNGDGNITVTDMIAIKAHVLKKSTLSGVYASAADTNGDSGISITDFIQVKAKILGKGTITAR